jgi:hypothetical protein
MSATAIKTKSESIRQSIARWRANPVEFIETVLINPETPANRSSCFRLSATSSHTLGSSMLMAVWSTRNSALGQSKSLGSQGWLGCT